MAFPMTWKSSTLDNLEGHWQPVRSAILITAGLLVLRYRGRTCRTVKILFQARSLFCDEIGQLLGLYVTASLWSHSVMAYGTTDRLRAVLSWCTIRKSILFDS